MMIASSDADVSSVRRCKHNGKPAGGMLHPVVGLRDAIERAGGAASERTLLWAFKIPGTAAPHLDIFTISTSSTAEALLPVPPRAGS